MARQPVNAQVAEDTVRESLGLSADDLGMNANPDSFGEHDNTPGFEDDDGDGGAPDRDIDVGARQYDLPEERGPAPREQQQRREPAQDDLTLQPRGQQAPPLPATAEVRPDAKGNLVDQKTGQVVARAGSEARMYQNLHKARGDVNRLTTAHTEVSTRLNRAVEIGQGLFDRVKDLQAQVQASLPATYGLTQQELVEAAGFAQSAKTDPVGTIQKLLTKAAAGGIDLTKIGLSGGNFDPKAFMDMVKAEIGTAMNPLKQRSESEQRQQQTQQQQTQEEQAAIADLNKFLGENPEARNYLPVFKKVYENPAFQHMTLGEVWAKLQLNLMRQRQNGNGGQRPENREPRRRQPQLPRGNNQAPRGAPPSELAPVNMSYEDIVRDILR